jgi:predicted nuclease of predicted toxin-antitoxin system
MPLADSEILATARSLNATIWTQDADFESLPDVRFKSR